MRRGRVALISAAVVGVVVLLLVLVLATRDPATDKVAKSPLVGKPAPAVRAETIDGETFDLDVYAGDWALVNFFATWCTPCLREHPDLVQLSEEGTLNLVSVVFQDDPGAVQEFFEQKGGDWPVVEDPSGRITLGYGVPRIPESFLVAPDGTVVAKFLGVRASTVNEVMERFR